MNLNFQSIQIPFTDFCILALILVLMYSVSAFESWLSPSGQSAAGNAKIHRKLSATWAFFGVLGTLAAGLAASANSEGLDIIYLSIPLFSISSWAMFHYRSSSDLIDPQVISDQIDRSYQDAVILVIAQQTPNPLTVEQIRALALESSLYVGLLAKGKTVFKAMAPIAVHDIIEGLIPTVEKTHKLLQELEKQGRIQCDEFGKYSIQRAIQQNISV